MEVYENDEYWTHLASSIKEEILCHGGPQMPYCKIETHMGAKFLLNWNLSLSQNLIREHV